MPQTQMIAAFIAKMTAAETVGGQVLDPGAALQRYTETFALIGWWGGVIGIGLLVASPILRYLAFEGRSTRGSAQTAPAE